MKDSFEEIGSGVSTFLQELNKHKKMKNMYRSQAAQAEYQAALVAAQAQAQNTYLLQSAAERTRGIYQNYAQTQAKNQTGFAAAGLGADSATVQYVLKNNRFQALLDERQEDLSLQNAVAQNNAQAAEQIRTLKELAAASRRASRKRIFGGRLSSVFLNLIGGN